MKQYCERFDVYYDNVTGEPLEPPCTDPDCEYCKDRPTNLAEHCRGCHKKRLGETYCKGVEWPS